MAAAEIAVSIVCIILITPKQLLSNKDIPVTDCEYGTYFYYAEVETERGKKTIVPAVIEAEQKDYCLKELVFTDDVVEIDSSVDPNEKKEVFFGTSRKTDDRGFYYVTLTNQKAAIPGRKDDSSKESLTWFHIVLYLFLILWIAVCMHVLLDDSAAFYKGRASRNSNRS